MGQGAEPGGFRKLYRLPRGRGGVLLGLCAGIAAHLNTDPVLVRLAFCLLVFVAPGGFAGIMVYLLFSLFVPPEPAG